MIVNKFIIVLCVIFLILLLRKLSYENFQATQQSAPSTQITFTDTINYNCENIDNDDVCKFLESVNICKHTTTGGCKPSCKFDINDQEFLNEMDKFKTPNQKVSYCLAKCQEGTSNSYCTNQECLELCNNLNLKSTV